MRFLLGFCLVLVACGGKLADDTSFDAGDATAKPDAPPIVTVDAALDVASDVAPGQCVLGPNVGDGTSDCGGDEVDWFATPYDPPVDITVDRIEAHMAHGNVALLASAGGTPGAPLFVGSVGSSPSPTWLGVDVNPPVVLHGGQSYFIGFQGGCSFAANGAEPVEYMAPSVNGPWHDQGVDNWTARLIGTCN